MLRILAETMSISVRKNVRTVIAHDGAISAVSISTNWRRVAARDRRRRSKHLVTEQIVYIYDAHPSFRLQERRPRAAEQAGNLLFKVSRRIWMLAWSVR